MKWWQIALVGLIALSAFLYWQNNALTVSEVTLSPKGLPQTFDGFKIVHLSDLHNKSFGDRLSRQVAELTPDIIVVSGDVVDSRRTDIEVAIEAMKALVAIAPVYYATGNHEERVSAYPEMEAAFQAMGVHVLRNEKATLSNGLDIIGLDDPMFGGDMAGTLDALITSPYSLVISHRPERFPLYVESGAAVVFSGHAHGGQIRLPFVGGLYAPNQGLLPQYTAGVHQSGETAMVVSRGLGNSAFPFRVFNRPEIVLVTLKGDGSFVP